LFGLITEGRAGLWQRGTSPTGHVLGVRIGVASGGACSARVGQAAGKGQRRAAAVLGAVPRPGARWARVADVEPQSQHDVSIVPPPGATMAPPDVNEVPCQ
jgi:hypothetical protein